MSRNYSITSQQDSLVEKPHANDFSTPAIEEFKATLSEEVPLCTGTVPFGSNVSQLFYRKADGSSGLIDFSAPVSDAQLESLAQACQPATFGVEQKDVLDESYRMARKMDAVDFSTNFNPDNTGITKAVCDLLLKDPQTTTRVELHKLNVYGPGSFFKTHVDTPQSPKMFGSLVVVLPTKHEGGTLLLRHHGREWTFDSANIVSAQSSTSPHAAFVAFFGDVGHEVSMVTSGYRVTLTYNLYFGEDDDRSIVPSILPIDDTEMKIKRSLIKLLNDKNFLPDGGLIGFGLSHLYPIEYTARHRNTLFSMIAFKSWMGQDNTPLNRTTSKEQLVKLGKFLKGADAAIKRACDSLSLDASAKVVYKSDSVDGVAWLSEGIADVDDCKPVEDDIVLHLKHQSDGFIVFDPKKMASSKEFEAEYSSRDNKESESQSNSPRPILWLKPLTDNEQILTPYLRYGNFATLNYAYGEICLVVEVKASNDRETYPDK